jgi:BED zinc finger
MLISAQNLNKANYKIQDYFANRQIKEDVKCNTSEQPTKKRKQRVTYSDVWKYFKKAQLGDDGSYEALYNYCGKCYKQGNQRSTSSLKHHIKKGCKKISWENRHEKVDAL